MRRTSLDICCTRSEMPQPCCGSRASVRRIKDRVYLAANRYVRACLLPCSFYREHRGSFVEVQGERARGEVLVRRSPLSHWRPFPSTGFRNCCGITGNLLRPDAKNSILKESSMHYRRDSRTLTMGFRGEPTTVGSNSRTGDGFGLRP